MPSVAWRYILLPLALVLTLSATSALAASSVLKPGCPAITRAQAAAAIGDVTKIEHHAQHTPGPGGGVTWLQQCTVHFQGGAVDIVFSRDERQGFDELRRSYAKSGRVDIVRGLGKAAFLYAPDPLDEGRELYVFHPSKISIRGLPPGPPAGAFAILPAGSTIVPVPGLVALARAVLQHPIRPLQNPKR